MYRIFQIDMMLIATMLILAYGIVSLVVMGVIASEGVDEHGNVYDETALTCGFGLGLIWPISLFAFGISAILPTLGKAFN